MVITFTPTSFTSILHYYIPISAHLHTHPQCDRRASSCTHILSLSHIWAFTSPNSLGLHPATPHTSLFYATPPHLSHTLPPFPTTSALLSLSPLTHTPHTQDMGDCLSDTPLHMSCDSLSLLHFPSPTYLTGRCPQHRPGSPTHTVHHHTFLSCIFAPPSLTALHTHIPPHTLSHFYTDRCWTWDCTVPHCTFETSHLSLCTHPLAFTGVSLTALSHGTPVHCLHWDQHCTLSLPLHSVDSHCTLHARSYHCGDTTLWTAGTDLSLGPHCTLSRTLTASHSISLARTSLTDYTPLPHISHCHVWCSVHCLFSHTVSHTPPSLCFSLSHCTLRLDTLPATLPFSSLSLPHCRLHLLLLQWSWPTYHTLHTLSQDSACLSPQFATALTHHTVHHLTTFCLTPHTSPLSLSVVSLIYDTQASLHICARCTLDSDTLHSCLHTHMVGSD